MTVKGTDAHSGVDEVEWVVDGGAPDHRARPQGQFTISADGAHTVQTRVRDVAGNESGWAQHTVNIDTTAPTDLTDAPDDWVQAAHVEVKATDAVSGVDRVEWQIDGGPWLHGPSGSIVHFTTTGEYQLRTRARDVAGNVSRAAARERAGRRGSPPPTPPRSRAGPVEQPVSGGRHRHATPTRASRASSGRSTAARQRGRPGDPAAITGSGTHKLKTRVSDAAGNWSAWRTETININAALGRQRPARRHHDGRHPTVWRKAPVTVTVQAEDAGSGVDLIEYQVPGVIGGDTQSATRRPFTVDTEGDNLLRDARDGQGSATGRPGARSTFKIDLTRPVDTTDIPDELAAVEQLHARRRPTRTRLRRRRDPVHDQRRARAVRQTPATR